MTFIFFFRVCLLSFSFHFFELFLHFRYTGERASALTYTVHKADIFDCVNVCIYLLCTQRVQVCGFGFFVLFFSVCLFLLLLFFSSSFSVQYINGLVIAIYAKCLSCTHTLTQTALCVYITASFIQHLCIGLTYTLNEAQTRCALIQFTSWRLLYLHIVPVAYKRAPN